MPPPSAPAQDRVPGPLAEGRHVGDRPGVGGDHLQDLAGRQPGERLLGLEDRQRARRPRQSSTASGAISAVRPSVGAAASAAVATGSAMRGLEGRGRCGVVHDVGLSGAPGRLFDIVAGVKKRRSPTRAARPAAGSGRMPPTPGRWNGRTAAGDSDDFADAAHAADAADAADAAGRGRAGQVGEGDRPRVVHRLPRLHHRLQIRERGPPGGHPHLRQVRRRRRLPAGPPRLPGHPLQPVRRRAVHHRLPDAGDVPAPGRHRRLRQVGLHRLQGVHGRLPLRRHLHQPRGPLGREVQLLRAPDRRRPRAGLRRRLPDRGDPGRRPRRPRFQGGADRPPPAGGGAPAGEGDAPQALLPRRPPGHPRPAGGAATAGRPLPVERAAAGAGARSSPATPGRPPRRPPRSSPTTSRTPSRGTGG